MKKWLYGIICVAFLGFITACGGGTKKRKKTQHQLRNRTRTADAGDGDALFQQSCASCHGGDLVSGGAPELDKIRSKYYKDEIEDIILNGKGGMPAGMPKGEDADAVASWLAEKK